MSRPELLAMQVQIWADAHPLLAAIAAGLATGLLVFVAAGVYDWRISQ